MKKAGFDLNQASSTSELVEGVKQPSKIRIVLFVLLIVVLVIAVVFIALYVKEKNENDDASQGSTGKGIANQCTTASCVKSANDILRSVDSSANPCDDFYQFSCGGFVKNNYIRDDQSNLNSFVIAQDNVDYSVKELIEKQELSNYTKGTAIYKVISFYQSCMNETQIEAAGTKPMLDIIAKYGSWGITNDTWSAENWSLEKVLARCLTDLGTGAFISLDISPSLLNASEVVFAVGAGSTGLGVDLDDKIIRTLTEEEALVLAYRTLMKTVFTLLGANSSVNASLDRDVLHILGLEIAFHQTKSSLTEKGEKFGYKNIMKYLTLEELNNLTSGKFNWTVYFEEVLRGTKQSIKPDQKVLVYLPEDIKSIISLLTDRVTQRIVANAIMWNVVHRFIQSMPKAFQDAQNEFNEVAAGMTVPAPRWKTCGGFANNYFPYAVALLYSEDHLSEKARKIASDMFIEIRKQFIDGLTEQTWMDDTTRKAAKVKLDAMKQDVGYPPFIKNSTKLNAIYQTINVNPVGFLDNILYIFKGVFENKIDQLDKPPDKSMFPRPPVGVNAFFNPQANGIAVLMGMFQLPFYESERLKALNYGGIGMVIGHEITHGFDVSDPRFHHDIVQPSLTKIGRVISRLDFVWRHGTGSQFDEVGNVRSWWTNTSLENFKDRSECLAKQYNKTYVFGRKVDGVKTLSENIADNGGLKYAFRAYQKWRGANGDEQLLPSLNYTNDQLFFIGFAQTWCAKYREQSIDKIMKDDSHSMNPVRVRIPVANFPAFHKTFGCKAPSNTCSSVW